MKTEYMYDIHNELMQINKSGAADRARGAAMIMEHYGDKEMADTLRLLSGQLDFDDSGEAGDAIKRTNEKLDKLIEEREKHHASAYISYLTDDMVLALSGGEVTDLCYSSVESSFLRYGLFDPDRVWNRYGSYSVTMSCCSGIQLSDHCISAWPEKGRYQETRKICQCCGNGSR